MKQRETKEIMKLGGSEHGWLGSLEIWCISEAVNCAAAEEASGGNVGLVGDEATEFVTGVPARESWFGSGCARGTQFNVYIVRRGIS